MGVFPVNGDGAPATGPYIAALEQEQYAGIEGFFAREAAQYGVTVYQPVKMVLYPEVTELPPRLEPGTGVSGRIWWSLKLRYYTWRQAGLLGVVYAFADEALDEPNNVVIAHEFLHTVGATDKYDPARNLLLFPQGYGDPNAEPRFPQSVAEIMAGRSAISENEAEIPEGLDEAIVGPQTAAEIRRVGD